MSQGTRPPAPFSERDFYLQEFRGRTLAIAASGAELRRSAPLEAVLRTLARNRTRAVLISDARAPLARLLPSAPLSLGSEPLAPRLWRTLRSTPRAGVCVGRAQSLAAGCREVATRLRLFKVVLLHPAGGVSGAHGERLSFVHQRELARWLRQRSRREAADRRELLREVGAMLDAGIPAVNLCTLEGLAEELFTYAGSGTLFTRERYVEVRPLGLDDLEPAHDLFRRGVAEGYLAKRPVREVDRILASAFGAFVEGRHLAGIAALLEHREDRSGEIASLYTVTRFLGEGIGAQLVRFALARARELGLRRVFACTTRERVGAFFDRQGFEPIPAEALPPGKWRGYDRARRARLRCYQHAVPAARAAGKRRGR